MGAISSQKPRTTLIPVTTMEEVAVLSVQQRAELVASLVEAEEEMAAGLGAAYDSDEARARFLRSYDRHKGSSASG